MENNKGLTTMQARKLRLWSKELCKLLNQDDFNHIEKIFKKAIERELKTNELLKLEREENNDK